ncbi:hypothetical protein BDV36DRAFT_288181 [Aspergillus pseudocaelatus]|uniref:Ferric reductase like transmembrane component-domain-containing protein n=1 Tax=Aspergillus pseudocaelatus TaxID=1825620 RepID=A0ABQ6W4N4_9EURO|nr:hypothetical protein BDV36DRAFT_288181 [Aspergillus pseudocaelatus]
MHSYHIIPLFAFTGLAHSWGVKSIYTSAKLYCSEEELSAGVNLWEDYCQGLSSPLNLDAILNNTTSSYLAELPHVDPSQYNRTILTSTVLLSHSYYLVAFHSYLAKDQALPKSTRLSWSVMGYWGVILLMGTLHLETWSASENNSYQTKLEYAYIAVPAALGSYHRRRFLGCSIPNRPEILVVVGFWIMCIILNFGFHDIFIPNATMPTISQQAWKYVAQRTSTFAYACLPWVWLFAGRNNIFIWATGWSFNTFNAFHRHLSRLTAIFAFFGIIGAVMMGLLCGLSIPCIRTKCYELFLIGHILFAVTLLVAVFQHTSVFGTKYNAYLWPVVAIWCFDRFLRIVRLAYCNIRVSTKGHVQTTTAMATYCKDTDVIRLDIQAGGSIRPLPGHYFHLYQLFSWRGWENHPFTVGACTAPNTTSPLTSSSEAPERCLHRRPPDVTTDPTLGNLVFWIRPYNGWTKRLKNQSLEGPYGHTIPLYHYGSVLMVVGGTGIATAVPYIQDHVSRSPKTGYRRSDDNKTQTSNLTLVWACRGHEFMEQLRGRELAGALKLEGFTGRFYCTKGCDSHCAADDNDGGLRIERGRPNIENIIHGAATEAQIVKHRMAVLTCGSPIMSDEVRRSVHSILKKGYEGIEYFEEAYSW